MIPSTPPAASARIVAALLFLAAAPFTLAPAGMPRDGNETAAGQLPSNSEIEIYAKTKPVIDLSAEELAKAYPEEMQDVKFADNPALLAEVLEKTGEKVEAFFGDFPKTLCSEQVRLERLNSQGRVEDSTTRNYLYSFSIDKTGNYWEETRTERNGRPIDLKAVPGFFLSLGRAGSTAFLHPRHQLGSQFRYLGRQKADPGAHVIAFAQKPEAGDYLGSYQSDVMAVPAPLLFQGFAWIHPENYQVLRMRTDLRAPRTDIGLTVQTTEIWFGEVRFESMPQTFWLPREVLVYNRSVTLNCRNRHRYSQFQIFTVSVEEKFQPVKK
jgi:hypothetical protein